MEPSHVALLNYVRQNSRRGDIRSVINAIDRYGWTRQWLMNIGDRKGAILDGAIRQRKPRIVLELGTFLGYSSLRMAARLPRNAMIFSVEKSRESAAIAHEIHKYAGVGNRIKIILDSTANAIPRFRKKYHIRSFDFIFIDHDGSSYLRDFMLLEQVGLIKSGTMIVADNVITPGAPDYLDYVQNNPNYTSRTYESTLEYQDETVDGVEVTIRK